MLSRLNANTNPINYKLAYEYCIGDNKAVIEALDGFIDSFQSLSDITAIRLTHQIFGKSEHDSEKSQIEFTNSVINVFDVIHSAVTSQSNWIDKLNDPGADTDHICRIMQKINGQIEGKIKSSVDDFKQIRSSSLQNKPMVYIDLLTRLKNKLHCEQMLPELLRMKGDRSVVLALIDINNFADFNRTHGVHMADSLLGAYGKLLDVYRKENNGYAWRVGDDEYALAIVTMDVQSACEKLMTLHENLKLVRFERKQIFPTGTTMAFGEIKGTFEEAFTSLKAHIMRNKNNGEAMYLCMG